MCLFIRHSFHFSLLTPLVALLINPPVSYASCGVLVFLVGQRMRVALARALLKDPVTLTPSNTPIPSNSQPEIPSVNLTLPYIPILSLIYRYQLSLPLSCS